MSNNQISFNHTATQALKYKKILLKHFGRVIDSGIFLNGPQATSLEKKLSTYFGNYILTCASGHDALLLAINSLSLLHTDEVIFPVNAYPTAFPVYLAGVKGVPVDVDENGQMSLEDLEKKITSKTKAVIIVHLYGLVGQVEKIITFLRKKKIVIIEDCAQAFGTLYKNKLVGTLGDIGCFSFYPTKNIGTLGDGGAVWTKHKRIFNYILKARAYGAKKRYKADFISGHSRLPELQAAVLHVYFDSFQRESADRRKLFKYYQDAFARIDLKENISFFNTHPQSEPVLHLFTIKVKKRNELQTYLRNHKIETDIHYPNLINNLPVFKKEFALRDTFPQAERLSKQIVSLPFHQYLKKIDIDYIVEHIKSFYEKK